MTELKSHILSRVNQQLDQLHKEVILLGEATKKSVELAVEGLLKEDIDACTAVIADDEYIDNAEVKIDEEGMLILLRLNPVASDLRLVVSSMNVSRSLERIADHATGIAKRARKIFKSNISVDSSYIEPLYELAKKQLNLVMEAYADLNGDKAREVILLDKKLDKSYKKLYEKISSTLSEHGEKAQVLVHLLFIARSIERIGDLSSNIGEDVVFIHTAQDIRHTG